MTITNKENGPYQVARTGLHGKLERSVLQVDRGAEATQDSTHAQADNECNKAEINLADDTESGCVSIQSNVRQTYRKVCSLMQNSIVFLSALLYLILLTGTAS